MLDPLDVHDVPTLLEPSDVARELVLSASSVRRLTDEGRLPVRLWMASTSNVTPQRDRSAVDARADDEGTVGRGRSSGEREQSGLTNARKRVVEG